MTYDWLGNNSSNNDVGNQKIKRMINKYQNVINALLDKAIIYTVDAKKSTWYAEVYPKPKIWVTIKTLKAYKNEKRHSRSSNKASKK